MMAQVIAFLPPLGETWIDFLAPTFSGGPVQVVVSVWGMNEWKRALFLSVNLSTSHMLCYASPSQNH